MEGQLVTDSRTQVKAQSKKVKSKVDRRKEELKKLLAIPEFRRYVWDLLDFSGVSRCSFDFDKDSALRMSFMEGQRNVGNKIQADIVNVAPEAFITMMKESQQGEFK